MFNFFKKNLTEEQVQQLDQMVEKFKSNPHQFRFTVVFFLTSIVFGILSIYLLQQKFSLFMQKNKVEIKEVIKEVNAPQPTTTIKPTKEATKEAEVVLKNHWTAMQNEPCNLITLVAPDENQKKWVYEAKDRKSSNDIFTQTISISLNLDDRPPSEEGVFIKCGINTDNWSSKSLAEKIQEDMKPKPGEQRIENDQVVSIEETSMWGKTAQDVRFSVVGMNGPHYIVTTDKHVYMISQSTKTENEDIKKNTQIIFDNIIFLD